MEIQERRYSAALLLMYALKEKDPAYAERFEQYSLACGDTLKGKPQYRQSKIQDLFADLQDTGSFYGKVCSEMRALLRPDPSEYYLLKADVKSMLGAYSDQWEKFKDMKDALHELYEFTDNRQEGFTEKKLMKLGGEENRRKIGEEIRKQAEALCNQKLKAKEGQSFSKLQQSLYGEGSDVYRALKIVAENRTDQLEEAYLVCTRFFTDGELNDDRILEVLNEQWGEQTKAFKKNPLQGNLRSTYSNRLRERLELISRWVMTFDAPADAKTSEDVLQYKNRLERCLKKAAESAEQETGLEAADKLLSKGVFPFGLGGTRSGDTRGSRPGGRERQDRRFRAVAQGPVASARRNGTASFRSGFLRAGRLRFCKVSRRRRGTVSRTDRR